MVKQEYRRQHIQYIQIWATDKSFQRKTFKVMPLPNQRVLQRSNCEDGEDKYSFLSLLFTPLLWKTTIVCGSPSDFTCKISKYLSEKFLAMGKWSRCVTQYSHMCVTRMENSNKEKEGFGAESWLCS